jgi:hypothetical protein
MSKRKKLNTTQRREFVFQLRETGLSYEEIARQTISKFGITHLPNGYCKRHVHLDLQRAQTKSTPSKLDTLKRRHLIWEARLAGLEYSQIVTQLNQEMGAAHLPRGYNASHACRDFQREQQRLDHHKKEQLEECKSMQQQRLNRLLQVHWENALAGDLKASEFVLKIIKTQLEMKNSTPTSTAAPGNLTFLSLYERATKKRNADDPKNE